MAYIDDERVGARAARREIFADPRPEIFARAPETSCDPRERVRLVEHVAKRLEHAPLELHAGCLRGVYPQPRSDRAPELVVGAKVRFLEPFARQ